MKKASILLVSFAVSAFGLAACGSDSDPETTASDAPTNGDTTTDGSGAGGTVTLSAAADNSFAYDTTSLSAKAGKVTIDFTNPATLSHDVVVEGPSGDVGKTDLISQSKTKATVDLTAGTYTFYCDVPGHREGGMEGTLTVS